MKRNPELAHEVQEMPRTMQSRHFAIDKISALSLAIQQLSRATMKELDPVDELNLEDRVDELLHEALYHWFNYRNTKNKNYELLLHQKEEKQEATIEKGLKFIDRHISDLQELKDERENLL